MSDTKYLDTHEWYIISENTFTVGISDFAQGELGDIVFVTFSTLRILLFAAENKPAAADPIIFLGAIFGVIIYILACCAFRFSSSMY